MENIQFEADNAARATYATAPKKSAMVKMVMKLGIQDEAVANYILVGVSVALLAFTFYMYSGMFSSPEVAPTVENVTE